MTVRRTGRDPLLAWKWSAGLVLVTLVLAAGIDRRQRTDAPSDDAMEDPRQTEREDFIAGRIASIAATRRDGPLVLVVGNSIVRRCLRSDAKLRQRLQRDLDNLRHPGPVHYESITYPALLMRHLRPSLDALVALRPALVVVEVDTAFERGKPIVRPRESTARTHVASRWALACRGWLGERWDGALGRGEPWSFSDRMITDLDTPFGAELRDRAPDPDARDWSALRAEASDPSWQVLLELLDATRDGPTVVCALQIPINEAVQDDAAPFLERRRVLIDIATEERGLRLLRRVDFGDAAYYEDASHMNLEGSRWFVDWLSLRLARLVHEGG